jgi:hypothetical protein
MDLIEWYEKGISFNEYMAKMKVNSDELTIIYNTYNIPSYQLSTLEKLKNKNWNVIVLAAEWCTDAMLCVPILQKICERIGFQQSILIRDENLELMDQYLTNGMSRSIPILIFIDHEGKEQFVWGPRSTKVEEVMNNLRNQLPQKDSSNFKEKQQEMYDRYKKILLNRYDLWDSTANSIVNKLVNVL